MIFFLCQYLLSLGIKVPSAFLYSSSRMVFAALTAFLVTMLLGPRVIGKLYSLKTGQSIRVEDCPLLAELHKKKKDTPTMGGVLILFAMLVSLFLWMDLHSSFTLILLITTLWLGVVGGIDDYLKMKYKNSKGLSARLKFFLQILLSSGIALYLYFPEAVQALGCKDWFVAPIARQGAVTLSLGDYMGQYYLPFMKDALFSLQGGLLVLGGVFTIFVITGSSNAVNLTDGLDGLAAGLLMMTSFVLGLFAFLSNHLDIARYLNILYISGSGEVAVYLFALIGATLGFLWYNGHPAQIFMGDVGSLSLGGILGVSAVLLRREFLLALVGGVFVAEALSVILQVGSYKLRNKKRIFLCSPLHHHFEYKGWPETKVVIRFWIVGLFLALLGIASLKLQ